MFSRLDADFAVDKAALDVRSVRQQIIASNVANADTPGYKARDFDFAQALNNVLAAKQPAQRLRLSTSDPRHIASPPTEQPVATLMYRNDVQPSVDGNTVDMNTEMANFADNALRYQASLTFMQMEIASLRTALQP